MATITFTFTVRSNTDAPLTATLILGSASAALCVRLGFAALLSIAPGAVIISSVTDTATGQLTALGTGSVLNGARRLQSGPAGVSFSLQAVVRSDAASVAAATALLTSPSATSGAAFGSLLADLTAALGRDATSLSGAVSPSSIAVASGSGAATGSPAPPPSIIPIAAGAGGGVLLLVVAAAWFACRRRPLHKTVAVAVPPSDAKGKGNLASAVAAVLPDATFTASNPVVVEAKSARPLLPPPPLAPTRVGLARESAQAKSNVTEVSAGPPLSPQRLNMARRSDGAFDYDELDRDELAQLAAERGISIVSLKVRDIRSKLAASDEAAAAAAVLAASPPTRKAPQPPSVIAPPPPPPASGAGLMLRAPAPLVPLRSRIVAKAALPIS